LAMVGLGADGQVGAATAIGEGASGVSVGQARRIGLARALARGTQVYFLDEPTAALDAQTESLVLDVVNRLRASGRTVLVVAHRPALIELADQIVLVSALPEVSEHA
jgi:ABC-type transport system involved in cytochrome bd biosynthesis fused ATPase/permease subunit